MVGQSDGWFTFPLLSRVKSFQDLNSKITVYSLKKAFKANIKKDSPILFKGITLMFLNLLMLLLQTFEHFHNNLDLGGWFGRWMKRHFKGLLC
jgi:hypothetical protein